jgi:hypothetical protein
MLSLGQPTFSLEHSDNSGNGTHDHTLTAKENRTITDNGMNMSFICKHKKYIPTYFHKTESQSVIILQII